MNHRTTQQAADYLGCRPKTLENWRALGRGPAYLKLGSRVLYPQQELDDYVSAHLCRPALVAVATRPRARTSAAPIRGRARASAIAPTSAPSSPLSNERGTRHRSAQQPLF